MPKLSKRALAGNLNSVFILAGFVIFWAATIPWAFGWGLLPVMAFALFTIYAIWLFVEAAKTKRSIRTLPDSPPSKADQRMGKQFGIIFGIEAALIAIAYMILGIEIIGDYNYIIPVIALIVGAHFIPLGVLFHTRLHIICGIIVSIVSAVALYALLFDAAWTDLARGICALTTTICVAILGAYALNFVKAETRKKT